MLRAGGQQLCPCAVRGVNHSDDQESPSASYPSLGAKGQVKGRHPHEVVILLFVCFVLFLNRRKPLLLEALRILWKRLVSWAKLRLWLEKSPFPVQALAISPSSGGENTPGFAISCMN